ncbi:MAG: PqqD family protein [Chloroflexota bacterium]
MDYKVNEDVIYRRIEDEFVLINLQSDQIFTLNQTGSTFWELLMEGLPVSEIRARLLDAYDVSPEDLDAEISLMVEKLTSEGLIERNSDR